MGIVLVVFLCSWSEASAQDLRWESFTGVSLNPLGLIQIGTFTASHPLYSSENPLFATNFVDASTIVASTPAYSIVGAQLQLQPLSILRLRARIEGTLETLTTSRVLKTSMWTFRTPHSPGMRTMEQP